MLRNYLTMAALGTAFILFVLLLAASWGEFSNDEQNELHNERD